jgi:hypothetical protein
MSARNKKSMFPKVFLIVSSRMRPDRPVIDSLDAEGNNAGSAKYAAFGAGSEGGDKAGPCLV